MKRLVTAFLMVGILGITVIAQTEQKRIVPPVRGEATAPACRGAGRSDYSSVTLRFSRIRAALPLRALR